MRVEGYRRDIDGLRAVAVLLVVLFHAGFPVSGGYVGVDVFFVISGYLITGILVREMSQQNFSYKAFYKRRIKRLIPALLVVFLGSILLTWNILLPEPFKDFLSSIRYAYLGISNFHFYEMTADYFAADAGELPLLHTWSLGVEEQFYVVWPLLMLAVFGLSRRISVTLFLLVLLVSLVLFSEWMVQTAPEAAYFMLPARAFELLMGGVVSLGLMYERIKPPATAFSGGLANLLGLALIAGSAFGLKHGSPFPGFNAVWPCTGSMLILWGGSNEHSNPVKRVLTCRPVVLIGLISYSFYLWHWPPVALAHYLNVDLTPLRSGLLVLGSGILAWVTWRWVENPCRAVQWSFGKTFVIMILVPMTGLFLFIRLIQDEDGLPGRLSPGLQAVARSVAHENAGNNRFKECFFGEQIVYDGVCLTGAALEKGQFPDFLLLGDSHAGSAAGFFEVMAEDAGLTGLNISRTLSPFLLETDKYKKDNIQPEFRNIWSEVFEYTQGGFNGFVVLAARWSRYMGEDDYFKPGFEEAIDHTLNILKEAGIPVVVYLQVPELPAYPSSSCRVAEYLENSWINSGDRCIEKGGSYPLSKFQDEQSDVSKLWSLMASRHPEIKFIDPKSAICDGEKCLNTLQGQQIYMDPNHLRYSGARIVASRYLQMFSNPLQNMALLDNKIDDTWR
jgi:peptidoglycan/LPS O-acetylase OafA/YrhL